MDKRSIKVDNGGHISSKPAFVGADYALLRKLDRIDPSYRE
jgi:hypothetical protein